MSKNDGGPAFPRQAIHVKPDNDRDYVIPAESGMSLRDWFAGQTLIATYLNGFAGPQPKERARICYEMADAMLKAREGE